MAGDNEVVACASSGMSYRTILLPTAVLGLVLTMGLFLMSNFVLPHFFRAATRTVESDVVTLLVSQLNRDQPFDRFEGAVLYADAAQQRTVPKQERTGDGPQPTKLIELNGVAMAYLDDHGGIRSDLTAETANAWLYYGASGRSWVSIRLRHVLYHDPERGRLAYTDRYDSPPMRMPSPFHDSPSFFTWLELRELNDHPDEFQPVRELKHQLVEEIAAARLRQEVRNALVSSDEQHELLLLGPREGERYTFRAPSIKTVKNTCYLEANNDQPVIVTQASSRGQNRRIVAQRVALTVNDPKAGTEPTVSAELQAAHLR